MFCGNQTKKRTGTASQEFGQITPLKLPDEQEYRLRKDAGVKGPNRFQFHNNIRELFDSIATIDSSLLQKPGKIGVAVIATPTA